MPVYVPQPDASYLITGGLGRLGLQVAQWLAGQGAQHLVLLGRHGPQERHASRLQALETAGAQVHIVTADVADSARMAQVFAGFGRDFPPLRGIVHTAADLHFFALNEVPEQSLSSLLAAKMTGAWTLHQLAAGLDLDFFVLFSSTTALWGVQGMGHYASANAFLDGLAAYRQALGMPALSINWGLWEEAGEQVPALVPMPTAQALTILGQLLSAQDIGQIAVASVNWPVLKASYEARRIRPLFEAFSAARPEPAPRLPTLRQELAAADAPARQAMLRDYIREAVAQVLGLESAQAVDLRRGLFEMGMDSLMSVELKSRLESLAGQGLPAALTFNYPSVTELAEYFEATFFSAAPEQAGQDIDDLSEDELEALLLAKLKELK